jgi:membrane protein required for colicin V production
MSLPGVFDAGAGLAILLLVVYGILKGMARLVLGFAGVAIGWALAARWCEPLALRAGASGRAAGEGPDFLRLAAFALIFLAVSMSAAVLAWLITRALGAAKLGGLNRLAGAGLGLLLGILLVCAASVPLLGMWPPDGGALMRGSRLAPYAAAGGQYLTGLTPEPLRTRFEVAARRLFEVSVPKPAPSPRQR